jgi:septal ring factor EnvC (AmiA/AmiB activator)
MALEMPELRNVSHLLQALEQASAKLAADLEEAEARTEEIAAVKAETETFEAEVAEARSRIFVLLREKFQDREVARAEAYGKRIEQALQALVPPAAVGKEPAKPAAPNGADAKDGGKKGG